MNQLSLLRLIDACCEVRDNPDYFPKDGKTFCNLAVNYIAMRMGYGGFQTLMANQITDLISSSLDWIKIDSEVAQYHANNGGFVIAAWKNPEGHGHVVVVRPGEFASSTKWKSDKVPKVINIGKDVSIGKGANYAFAEVPNYYVLKTSI